MDLRPVQRECASIRGSDMSHVMKDWCCLINSELLGEKIVLVDREPHVERARMLYPDSVVYTCDEVSRMDGAASAMVKDIHDVKKAFNGSFMRMLE